jgi:hypothetical protein
VSLWLVFLLLSGVFALGWSLGSSLGYQAGRSDAEDLGQLRIPVLHPVDLHVPEVIAAGSN